jgi:hypothetical protein
MKWVIAIEVSIQSHQSQKTFLQSEKSLPLLMRFPSLDAFFKSFVCHKVDLNLNWDQLKNNASVVLPLSILSSELKVIMVWCLALCLRVLEVVVIIKVY